MNKVKQLRVLEDSIVFYRDLGKIVQLIGILTEEEIQIGQNDPSLLEEDQIIRLENVTKELIKDAEEELQATRDSNV